MNTIDYFTKCIEDNIQLIKSKQNNKLWIEDIDNQKDIFEQLGTILLMQDNSTMTYDDFFLKVRKYITSNYRFLIESKPEILPETEATEFDPLDGTWLTPEKMEELRFSNDSKHSLSSTRWGRYLNYLSIEKKFPKSTIKEVANSSLQVLSRCADPKASENYFIKGMVVGSVQSGKTTNFNAVVNAAYDIGYDLVIVLTGITEGLRRQTQERLNTDLGICEINKGVRAITVDTDYFPSNGINSFTSESKDFDKGTLLENKVIGGQQSLIVAKKNNRSLFNIYTFLKNKIENDSIDIQNFNVLVIDDEADSATLNSLGTNGDENQASTINGLLRGILGLFNRKTYVAYTATPFANILQDDLKKGEWHYNNQTLQIEENLYPRNFVRLLTPPRNYIGAHCFFKNDSNNENNFGFLIENIDDYKDHFPNRIDEITKNFVDLVKTEKEFKENTSLVERYTNFKDYLKATCAPKVDDAELITSVPNSLIDAIYCFIITIAIRDFRANTNEEYYQQQLHNTMLIHISRFSSWQEKLKTLLQNDNGIGILDQIKKRITNDKIGEGIYKELERVWNNYFEYIVGNLNGIMQEYYHDEYIIKHSFSDIVSGIPHAIKKISVISANYGSNDELTYDKTPKNVIVIGGNKLSRGFTLEGLSISYFTRTTNYADSILQMGRWFGYRPGYLDCCRLFVDRESLQKFEDTVELLYELESDIKQHMADVSSKPHQIINRIKSVTGSLLKITRPNILKNASRTFYSFSDKLIQTTKFDLDKELHEKSYDRFKTFVHKYSTNLTEQDNKNIYALKNQSFSTVQELINTSLILNDSFDRDRLYKFITDVIQEHNYLSTWDIFFINKGEGITETKIEDITFSTVKRSGPNKFIKVKKQDNGTTIEQETKIENKLYYRLKDDKFFTVRNSNLISPADIGLGLSFEELQRIENRFKQNKTNKKEADYRKQYNKEKGILLVYLIDTKFVLFPTTGKSEEDLEINSKLNLNTEIPIVGFAIGITDLDIEPKEFFYTQREEESLELELNEIEITEN